MAPADVALVALLSVIVVPLLYYRFVYYETNLVNIYYAALPVFAVREEHPAYYIPYYALALCFLLLTLTYREKRAPEPAVQKKGKQQDKSRNLKPLILQFGPRELVYAADSMGVSATFPRISPDGRYLMFTQAQYGIFHIWHHDADLWLLDLKTGEARCMDEINSNDTESYHSWSSNITFKRLPYLSRRREK